MHTAQHDKWMGVDMQRMGLKTHETARLTLGRLIRSYHRGEMESQHFRDLIYSMTCLLSFFKHASDVAIEARLIALEDQLAAEKHGEKDW